ncbi:MAG: exodeoxyribonuclease V subunit gamma, partial [Acidimicrobiia bacterium]|nr:exodeoxyribonuclease V subunit gamma [Acidimicrobiia bacterium]
MLHLHRSERADALVDRLGDILSSPLPDPLQSEVIAVPTRGVERWLTQRLSHRLGITPGAGRSDGVCANVAFPFPGRLVGDAMAAACGIDRDQDPWRPERAAWPLLDLLDEHLGEPWLTTVSGHLGASAGDTVQDEIRRSRRFSTARHITDLYDRYSVHRPAMVRAWGAGDDVTGAATPLPADGTWQPELWRRLRGRIGSDSPAERLEGACADLAADASLADLPARFSLFGLTRLPASYLDVLRSLAVARDVHLFLLHPSPVLWGRVGRLAGADGTIKRRADDPTAEAPVNPLLRSWGRDAR